MIKIKKWLLLTVCVLCLLAALLGLSLSAYAADGDKEPNVIGKSDGTVLTDDDLALEWTYGTGEIISYTYRPEHGDTVYYTLSQDGEEQYKFAAVIMNDGSEIFYELKDGEIDTSTQSRVNSLKAYLRTLKTGNYTLNVVCPEDDTYLPATLDVDITVNAYEITQSNLGTDDSSALKYRIQTPEVAYTGEADNVPQIELTFKMDEELLILAEGEDYVLSSDAVDNGDANLTIKGIGCFTGEVTVQNAYKIGKGDNSVSGVHVVPWKYGEYDRNINLFTANVKWGEEDLYFAITTDANGEDYVAGLDEIRLTDGKVSSQVEKLLNGLDAKKPYYLFAKVDGGNNYFDAGDSTQFDIIEMTNTWTTTPNVISWEWHGFDENVNVINAAAAFGGSVEFSIYTKDGNNYTALKFGGAESFELENGNKLPAAVVKVLSELDAGTYYLFASVKSDTDNYTSINAQFSEDALVPFRVLQARNYWTQIPQISNWSYGNYDGEVNVISATPAHGSSDVTYSIYKQTGDGFGILKFGDTSSFTVDAEGAVPAEVSEGLKALGEGKYYLRARVSATNNYTGLQDIVFDYSELSSFNVIKAENYWSTAPAISAWSEGNYSNEENLPVAAAHYGVARIIITDVNDAENVIYDSENNINKLAEAGVGAYLLTATVAGTGDYGELTFDTIFHIFVPETARVGVAWWLVLILVICSLGVLVFIFWLLHETGVLQLLSGKMIVAMRTKATMDATIAAIKANKVAEDAKESVRLAEELDRLEAEIVEGEEDDSNDEVEDILLERDEETGMATFVRYKKSFSVKLIQASDEAKNYYSELKNVLLSYKKVKSKVSDGYDTFNKGRTQLAKLVIRGKTLCIYLALNPDDYADTEYKVERSESKKYASVPCLYRIKNARRLKYAEELINTLCEKLEIEQGENKHADYRPPYESTEALMEKGLIKKVVYKRKYSSFINKGTKVAVKTEDESKLKLNEAAVTNADDAANSEKAENKKNPGEE